jgi:hypothetical protein
MPKTKRRTLFWIIGWLMIAIVGPLVPPCTVLCLLINAPILKDLSHWEQIAIEAIALFMGYSIHRGVTEPAFNKRVDKITHNLGGIEHDD